MAPLKGGLEGGTNCLEVTLLVILYLTTFPPLTMSRIKIGRRSVAGLKGVLDRGWDGLANGANGDLGHSASARPAVNIQKVILH